jgi:hypothetical protein
MRYGLVALGAALIAGASAKDAQAQVSASSMLSSQPERSVIVKATGSVDYDSNIAKVSATEGALQGLTLADTTYTPSLVIDATVPVGRQVVFLTGSASYLFHQNNKQLDHDQYNFTGGMGNVLGPCGTTESASFFSGRTQLADTQLVTSVEDVLTTVGVTAGLSCSRPSGLGFVANAHYQDASNSATQLTNSDFNVTNASAGLSYGRPSLGTLTIQGTYSKAEYPHRTGGFQSAGYETTGATIEYSRQLGGKIQLAATVGYNSVNPGSEAAAATTPATPGAPVSSGHFRGVIYSFVGSYRASSRLSANLDVNRQVTPTLIAGRSFEVQTSYDAGLSYKIGSRITARLGAQEADLNAQGGVAVDPALSLTDSKLRILLANVTYRQNRRLTLNFSAQHEQRTSDNARFDYTGYRVGVSAGVTF